MQPREAASPPRASLSPRKLRAGVVGTGALGRHHVRILSDLPGVELVGIHDLDPAVAEKVGVEFGARVYPGLDALAEEVEAVVLAVPTVDHAAVGRQLLGRGIHLLVEKPIATSLEEADALLEASRRSGVCLAVGHVEFFNPAVQVLLEARPGVRYAEIQRLGVFTPRSLDVDVVLDLMIHDLQILHALDPSPLREVRATGIDVLTDRIDIANARIELASGCVANLTASRVSSERVRKLRVYAIPKGYYSLDYREQGIKGYRLEVEGGRREIVRADLEVTRAEPLRRELQAFVAACRGGRQAVVTGEEGRRALGTALQVLERIERRREREETRMDEA